MVAPSRIPQARGVKCDRCKEILSLATWLDQTKLAKEIQDAEKVLELIRQHNDDGCPCIPKNIENLLVGSTHFEIHRLYAKQLDLQVHKKQIDCYLNDKQRHINETPKSQRLIINDCYDSEKSSRFGIYHGYSDQKHVEQAKLQLNHLFQAINYWQVAMEDQTNPFNAKLAHRLGLTHHVIYACYLFKYHKLLEYQLVAANLLLNIFRSIEGVTANAILHAHFLLVKSLMDCGQLQLARQYLKQATRMTNSSDKSHYEFILLQCVACELDFMEGREFEYNQLDELADLAKIRPDDKLQHYYARTLAISILMRYINHFPSRNEQCFEFFHAYRYVCAIVRRCYESSFDIVLAEKEIANKPTRLSHPRQIQILDHSWIKFAVCDFVFTTFEHLVDFYMRAGIPECLNLLYNGLNLISFRNGSLYWQSKVNSIGSRLDLLCDKYTDAKEKLDVLTRLVGYANDPHLMNVLRLESEVSLMTSLMQQGSVIGKDVISDVLDRAKFCRCTQITKLGNIELFDVKSDEIRSIGLTSNSRGQSDSTFLGSYLGNITLQALRIGFISALRDDSREQAMIVIDKLKDHLNSSAHYSLTYSDQQAISEMLLHLANIDNSEQQLLQSIKSTQVFLKMDDNLSGVQQQLSSLTLTSEPEKNELSGDVKKKTTRRTRSGKLPFGRPSRRKGAYEVAQTTQDNDLSKTTVRLYDVVEALTNAFSLSKEEIVSAYLRNSEPNPHYELYRRAHELMLSYRLMDEHPDTETILYHISESNPSNSMRYRWMMMEEHQSSAFDESRNIEKSGMKQDATPFMRLLGFCNTLANQENSIKSMTRAIPDATRILQLKYIHDKQNEEEHLLCASFNSSCDPIFLSARRSLVSDDFFNDAIVNCTSEQMTLPSRFVSLIEESRKSLLDSSQRSRSEKRSKIESDLSIILHDVENDWLGPFKFLMCGDICDQSYNKFVDKLLVHIQKTIMKGKCCLSQACLRLAIENAPLLRRDEFCQVMSVLFNCPAHSEETRKTFNRWQDSLESFMETGSLITSKTAFLRSLERGQIGLILDNRLGQIPFESLQVAKDSNQGVFRAPSLRLFSIIATRRCTPVRIDPSSAAYVLDPASNLVKTRDRFDQKLKAQSDWTGVIARPPDSDELEKWLASRELYLFIGHGAGTAYYNKLCKGRGLTHVPHISSAAIVMGCSSGRMLSEGPRLEPFGIGWVFILRGSPSYLGLLWDVTDNDIDKYLDSLLDKWMPSINWSKPSASDRVTTYSESITNASARARDSCQLKLLVGSTPVVYGLPIWCKA